MRILEAVEGGTLVHGQRDTVLDAQWQVGLESSECQNSMHHGCAKRTDVGNIMTSKGDQPAQVVSRFCRVLRGVPASGDEHLIAPDLPEEVIRLQAVVVTVFDPRDTTFSGVKVSKVGEPRFGLRNEVGKSRFWVLHPHSLPGIPRGDTESDSVFANSVRDSFDDFERELGTVLN